MSTHPLQAWDDGSRRDGIFRELVLRNATAILVLDETGRIVFSNPRACTLFDGLGTAQSLPLADLFEEADRSAASRYAEALLGGGTTSMFFAGWTSGTSSSGRRYVHVHGANLTQHAVFAGAVITAVDATATHEREMSIARTALRDPLTGLANRALLDERLRQMERSGQPGALLILDIDNFKQVNDDYGHQVGDLVLMTIGQRIQYLVREEATPARFGGDEFVVLMPAFSLDQASELAEQIRRLVSTPVPDAPDGLLVTASIGVAAAAGGLSRHALRDADSAMYRAKRDGRDQVAQFSPETDHRADLDDLGQLEAAKRTELLRANRRLRQAAERARAEARTDVLTGLPNRRALDELLTTSQLVDGPHPDEPLNAERQVAVLFVDVDRFSSYNHANGDWRGDETLAEVGKTMAQTVRSCDSVYRKGGEEFVIVLPDAGMATATEVAERIRSAIEGLAIPHGGAPDTPIVTVTIGVAARLDGDTRAAMLAASDLAFAAKRSGRRNRVTSS